MENNEIIHWLLVQTGILLADLHVSRLSRTSDTHRLVYYGLATS
jgi:hypothetical protein